LDPDLQVIRWLGVHIIVHTYDVLMAFDFVYGVRSGLDPPCQALVCLDHSAQHGHHKKDSLSAVSQNAVWGGNQSIVRDTKIERHDGFLGPLEAKYPNGVDGKLKVGELQKGYFHDPTRPPFYDVDSPPGTGLRIEAPPPPKGASEYDRAVKVGEANKEAEAKIVEHETNAGIAWPKISGEHAQKFIQARSIVPTAKRAASAPKGKVAELRARAATLRAEDAPLTIDLSSKPVGYDDWRAAADTASASVSGWLGQPKGAKQLVWERGLFVEGMKGDTVKDKYGVPQTFKVPATTEDGDSYEMELPSSVKAVLASCFDYENEISEVAQMVIDLGHLCQFTPKGHCEVVHIEYEWGCSSRYKRRNTSDEDCNLFKDTLRSLSPHVLPVLSVRRFERTAWRYKQAYRRKNRGEATDGEKWDLERLQKLMRKHRDADVELAYLEGRRENPLSQLEAPANAVPAIQALSSSS
jgi:hypothetical protein